MDKKYSVLEAMDIMYKEPSVKFVTENGIYAIEIKEEFGEKVLRFFKRGHRYEITGMSFEKLWLMVLPK